MKKAAEVLGTALREAFQKQISNTLNVSGSADYLAVSAQSDGLRKRKTAGGDQVASVNVCLPLSPTPSSLNILINYQVLRCSHITCNGLVCTNQTRRASGLYYQRGLELINVFCK
jgi:hypothetical protein